MANYNYRPAIEIHGGVQPDHKFYYFVAVTDQRFLVFTKDLKLVEAEDIHYEAKYKTKEDLDWFKTTSTSGYRETYQKGLKALKEYIKDPAKYDVIYKRNIEYNHKLWLKELDDRKKDQENRQKKRETDRSKMMEPHLKYPYLIEIFENGKFYDFKHADTLIDARKKSYDWILHFGYQNTMKIYKKTSKGYVQEGVVARGPIGEYSNVFYWKTGKGTFVLHSNGYYGAKIQRRS